MGIRFRCPNGHKLNVKDFLAGKRGICPKCGVKLQIPLSSDPMLVRDGTESKRHRQAASSVQPRFGESRPGQPSAIAEALHSSGSASSPGSEPVADVSQIELLPEQRSDGRLPSGSQAEQAEPPDLAQPTEKPALWFVRPISGGQYGPASATVFQSWMQEGRVTADAYVWREGWSDWRPAGDVFPELCPAAPRLPGTTAATDRSGNRSAPRSLPADSTAAAATVDSAELPQINTSGQRLAGGGDAEVGRPQIIADDHHSLRSRTQLYRSAKSTKMFTMTVVILTLACAVLMAALIYVVRS